MKRHAGPLFENVAESTTACLLAMVQGNLLVVGLTHWLVALETGLIAGVATSIAMIATRIERPWIVSGLLGAVTMVVDFFVHPGGFGPVFAEAMVTGLTAGLLSLGVHFAWRRYRAGGAA